MVSKRRDILDICHFVIANIIPRLLEQLLSFGKSDPYGWLAFGRKLEVAGFRVAFFLEDVSEGLVLFSFLQLADNEGDKILAEGENFVIMIYYRHFEVEAGELRRRLAFENPFVGG